MSRIGKQPVSVPDGVEINIEPELVSVKGPKGELSERKSREIEVKQEDGQILVTRPTDRGEHRALHGLTRSLIANMVEGVTNGFEKRLDAPISPTMRWLEVAPAGASTSLALNATLDTADVGTDTGVRFTVPDAAVEHSAMRDRGVLVGDLLRWDGVPPMFTFDDPDGNRLWIGQSASPGA